MKFEISQEDAQKLLDLLADQPYRYVHLVIPHLQASLKPIEESRPALKEVSGE